MDLWEISCWAAGLSLTIKTKRSSDRHDTRFYSTNVASDTSRFSLGSGTLTHSVFTAGGSLSAVFTHITGVKRGRFHNEVQRFMAVGIKMPSESRNRGPFVTVPGEISGLVSTEAELSTNPLKWCEVTCTSDALKNLPRQCEKYTARDRDLNINKKDSVFPFSFAHRRIVMTPFNTTIWLKSSRIS